MADPLLESFQLKHLHLKNRIITTSHEPAYNDDGFPKDRYIAYHLERAKGGIAMTKIKLVQWKKRNKRVTFSGFK
jgi:2,4-dienoyl-CoA reductase-like NADH-dependent reductase (Old Yellow Enzyme family)